MKYQRAKSTECLYLLSISLSLCSKTTVYGLGSTLSRRRRSTCRCSCANLDDRTCTDFCHHRWVAARASRTAVKLQLKALVNVLTQICISIMGCLICKGRYYCPLWRTRRVAVWGNISFHCNAIISLNVLLLGCDHHNNTAEAWGSRIISDWCIKLVFDWLWGLRSEVCRSLEAINSYVGYSSFIEIPNK